jgi:hypothetical protein
MNKYTSLSDGIDLHFRPSDGIFKLPRATFLLGTVKGEQRRRLINAATRADTLEQLAPWLLQPSLSGIEQTHFERIHPQNMGGEYLPNLRLNEIEIARISIQSTTGDVTSVFCKPTARGFSYRVVDEYNGECLMGKSTRTSKHPLSLGELLTFFLGAWNLEDVLEAHEFDVEAAQDFVTASSLYYPDFAKSIQAQIHNWRSDATAADDDEEADDAY